MCRESTLVRDRLFACALLDDATIKYAVNAAGLGEEVESVGDEDAHLVTAVAEENIVEDGFADVGVENRKRVVEDRDGGVGIYHATNVHALLLAARLRYDLSVKLDTTKEEADCFTYLLANFGHVASREYIEVGVEAGIVNG